MAFLEHPERFGCSGAIGPRGLLVVGPPGTERKDAASSSRLQARQVSLFAATGTRERATISSALIDGFTRLSDSLVRTLWRPTLSHPLSSSGTGTDPLSLSRVSVVDSSRQNLPARNPTARHHAEIFMPIPRSWCSRRGAGGIVSGLP